jgi:hypothetical protein
MGAAHFLMKTLPRVAAEMALHVLAYNLTRVINIMGLASHCSNAHIGCCAETVSRCHERGFGVTHSPRAFPQLAPHHFYTTKTPSGHWKPEY